MHAGCVSPVSCMIGNWSAGVPAQVQQPCRLPPGARLQHSSVQPPPTRPPLSAAAGAGGLQQPPQLQPVPSADPQLWWLPCRLGAGPERPPAGWPAPTGSMRHSVWAALHPWSWSAWQAPCAAHGVSCGSVPAFQSSDVKGHHWLVREILAGHCWPACRTVGEGHTLASAAL